MAGCKWVQFGGGNGEGCIEPRDGLAILTGILMQVGGWLMLMWTVGWARRNFGDLERIRHKGHRISGTVLERDCSERTMLVGGWPLRANVFALGVEYTVPGEQGPRHRVVNLQRQAWEQAHDQSR